MAVLDVFSPSLSWPVLAPRRPHKLQAGHPRRGLTEALPTPLLRGHLPNRGGLEGGGCSSPSCAQAGRAAWGGDLGCPLKTEPRSLSRPIWGWCRGPAPLQASSASRAHQEPNSTFTKVYRRELLPAAGLAGGLLAVDSRESHRAPGRLQDYLSLPGEAGGGGHTPGRR